MQRTRGLEQATDFGQPLRHPAEGLSSTCTQSAEVRKDSLCETNAPTKAPALPSLSSKSATLNPATRPGSPASPRTFENVPPRAPPTPCSLGQVRMRHRHLAVRECPVRGERRLAVMEFVVGGNRTNVADFVTEEDAEMRTARDETANAADAPLSVPFEKSAVSVIVPSYSSSTWTPSPSPQSEPAE